MDKTERKQWQQAYEQCDRERIILFHALDELRKAVMEDVPGHHRTPKILNALYEAEKATRP